MLNAAHAVDYAAINTCGGWRPVPIVEARLKAMLSIMFRLLTKQFATVNFGSSSTTSQRRFVIMSMQRMQALRFHLGLCVVPSGKCIIAQISYQTPHVATALMTRKTELISGTCMHLQQCTPNAPAW